MGENVAQANLRRRAERARVIPLPRRPAPEEAPVAVVRYTDAIDELVVTYVDDAPDVDSFVLVPDIELIFDATEHGRLLSAIVRGARLGRPPAWLELARVVCGASAWRVYEDLLGEPSLVGEDQGRVEVKVDVPAEQWLELRSYTWRSLHESLLEAPAPLEAPVGDVPAAVAAPLPQPGRATYLVLPPWFAAEYGLEPMARVSCLEDGAVLMRFDVTEEGDRRASQLAVDLIAPFPARATKEWRRGYDGWQHDTLFLRFPRPQRGMSEGPALLMVARPDPHVDKRADVEFDRRRGRKLDDPRAWG